jgi:hypothetical protein
VTLTVTVTVTVTQNGRRTTVDVDDDGCTGGESIVSPLASRFAEDQRCAIPQEGSRGQQRNEDYFNIEAEWRTRALGSVADGAAAFGGALSHRADVG